MGAPRDEAPSEYVEILVERCVADIIAGKAQIDDYLKAYPALADELERRLEVRLVNELSERVRTRLAGNTE